VSALAANRLASDPVQQKPRNCSVRISDELIRLLINLRTGDDEREVAIGAGPEWDVAGVAVRLEETCKRV
jgi:hypothetical protein